MSSIRFNYPHQRWELGVLSISKSRTRSNYWLMSPFATEAAAVITALNCLHFTSMSWRSSLNRKETSYLTTSLHKPTVVVEVVTTFSSFRFPELSQSI